MKRLQETFLYCKERPDPFFLFFLFAMTILAQNVYGTPPVQVITPGNGIAYNVNVKKTRIISFPASVMKMKIAADWLAHELSGKTDHRWQIIAREKLEQDLSDIEIRTMPETSPIPFQKTDKRYHEAYIIHIDNNIKLYAGGSAGALYGVQKLNEKIREASLQQDETIIDYPDYKWRGIYIYPVHTQCGSSYMLKNPEDKNKWSDCMEKLIDHWRSLRINALFLQSYIFYRLNDGDIQLLDRLFRYARRNNIEPVPVLASKLWGVPLDYLKPDAIEGIFHKAIEFKAESGSLEPVKTNSIDNTTYTWAIKHNFFLPEWYTVPDSEKKQQIALDQSVNNKPWKNPVFLKNTKGSTRLKVRSGQYYELMLSIRSNKNQATRVGITTEEFDDKGNKLKKIHRYTIKAFTNHYWRKRWFPAFVSANAHAITVRIVVENRSDEKVHVEIAEPTFVPMQNQLINVLVNKETAPVVQSKDGKIQYIRGKDYQLNHAEIKEWREVDFNTIKKTEIKLLSSSRIHNGQYLNVSFDTLPLEYRAIPMSKYSVASSYTYQEYQRIFNRLKKLSPKFIHVSLDEHAGGLNRDSRSLKLGLCNRDLYISYINTLDNLLHKQTKISLPIGGSINGAGLTSTQLIVWDDMLNPWHNGNNTTYQVPFGGKPGGTGLFDASECSQNIKLQQRVLLASWWYQGRDERGVVKNTPAFYRKRGYQYFMSTWYQQKGIGNWINSVNPSETKGFIATTWNKQKQGVPAMACAAWNRAASNQCLAQSN